jgi:hypothetical protein
MYPQYCADIGAITGILLIRIEQHTLFLSIGLVKLAGR